jgi:hypothetical protein
MQMEAYEPRSKEFLCIRKTREKKPLARLCGCAVDAGKAHQRAHIRVVVAQGHRQQWELPRIALANCVVLLQKEGTLQ